MNDFNLTPQLAKLQKDVEEIKLLLSNQQAPPTKKRTVLTAAQAMERLQISESTFHRWIKNGVLKVSKVGGLYRIHEKDIDELLNQ